MGKGSYEFDQSIAVPPSADDGPSANLLGLKDTSNMTPHQKAVYEKVCLHV